jgi:hypothetical protein
MDKHWVKCECGGGADVVVPEGSSNGMAECACGKMLFWTPGLSFGVTDSVSTNDVFGG